MRVLVTFGLESVLNILRKCATMILEIQKGRKWQGLQMCNDCDRKQLIEGWTSGNTEFDQIIKETQQNISGFDGPCLKWIWVEIGKGEYGTAYSTQWIGAKFTEIETHVVSHKVTPIFNEMKVAIKVFNDEKDFLNEIRPLNISRVEASGKYCLVMNYAEHKDLASYLRQNPNPSADFKIKILLSLTKSLKVLHNQNLIHRNIHCGNILLESQTVADETCILTYALTG
ncbi:serine/threonine protein kinase [Gigaspora margarita]|uniref:Serine/threonine protein kinase n=1 Tax=Gigaspora margarita TaxID=4874 RepID=A0A8H3X7Z8_GIGMA|nr:serine/threonine protein kinase [Gigaspora margarita]